MQLVSFYEVPVNELFQFNKVWYRKVSTYTGVSDLMGDKDFKLDDMVYITTTNNSTSVPVECLGF